MKNIIYIWLLVLISSCVNFDVDNTNEPSRVDIFKDSNDIIAFTKSTYLSTFKGFSTFRGVALEFLADQITSLSSSRWNLNKEPRVNIPNMISNNDADFIYGGSSYSMCSKYYRNIDNANTIIKGLKSKTVKENGEDISELIKANSLFIRGLNLGYLGVIYRRAAIMKPNMNRDDIKFYSYKEVIDAAIKDLEDALKIFKNHPGYELKYIEGKDKINVATLEKIINTYCAKFLIASARSEKEAQDLDYSKIEKYLTNTITEDFILKATGRSYYNALNMNLCGKYRNGKYSGSIDQKIIYLLSQVDGGDGTNAPKKRPEYKKNDAMDSIKSKDKRLGLYFKYTSNPTASFYYFQRDPRLFSDYSFIRYQGRPSVHSDYDLLMISVEEVNLLKAEVKYRQGDYAVAKEIIDAGRRVTVGELNPLSSATKSIIADALFYENSIELFGGGLGINWTFMRRHDRLQKGTLLHLPVHAQEVKGLNLGEPFQSGGVNKADGVNTANETPTSWIKVSEMN